MAAVAGRMSYLQGAGFQGRQQDGQIVCLGLRLRHELLRQGGQVIWNRSFLSWCHSEAFIYAAVTKRCWKDNPSLTGSLANV
jgi:hypothetical protein